MKKFIVITTFLLSINLYGAEALEPLDPLIPQINEHRVKEEAGILQTLRTNETIWQSIRKNGLSKALVPAEDSLLAENKKYGFKRDGRKAHNLSEAYIMPVRFFNAGLVQFHRTVVDENNQVSKGYSQPQFICHNNFKRGAQITFGLFAAYQAYKFFRS